MKTSGKIFDKHENDDAPFKRVKCICDWILTPVLIVLLAVVISVLGYFLMYYPVKYVVQFAKQANTARLDESEKPFKIVKQWSSGQLMEFEGHQYLMFYNYGMVHSKSCSCKNK